MQNDVGCGDYLKVLYYDGTGLCLFAKRLESGRFVWPPIVDGKMVLTPAQLTLLIGRTHPPEDASHTADRSPSTPGDGWAARDALVSAISPIERNPSDVPAGDAADRADDADEDASEISAAGRVPNTFRQLNTWFEFSPWRRATSATDMPGRNASSTIRRFSSSGHERRETFTPSLASGNALTFTSYPMLHPG
jgi:IS66 Orf2 like protein